MAVNYITKEELKELWRMLERLQADVQAGTWVWSQPERDALVIVMDAVKDTYTLKK